MLTHTHGANPSDRAFLGFDSSRLVQAFSSHVLMSGFFFPEDLGKIAPAFPCMFQSELHGVPEPGGSEPGTTHDSQGMPGLDEGGRALRGERCGTGSASSRGCQRHSDQIKAIPAPAAHCSFPNSADC